MRQTGGGKENAPVLQRRMVLAPVGIVDVLGQPYEWTKGHWEVRVMNRHGEELNVNVRELRKA